MGKNFADYEINHMLCLAALIIFAVLSLFSATHRQLAKEAFECVLNRARLRPCEASVGDKVKTGIVGWLMTRNMTLARIFNRYAEIFAWAFVILSIATTLYTGRGIYNLVRFGTCNLNNPQSCIFSSGKRWLFSPQQSETEKDLDKIEQRLQEGAVN